MKKPILFLIVLALVSACANASQVTATLEVTSTPPATMTNTPTPSPTMTETPLETPHIEDFIKITSSLPVETLGTETTPRIAGAFEVDEALCFGCEIQMPEALAEEILGGYMARFMHRFGAEAREGQPNEAEIASALEKIAQAQRGEIPASEAVMTIPAYLLSQGLEGEYSEVKIVFRMGTDMQVPEGVIPIDSLSTLDVEGYVNGPQDNFDITVKEGIPGFVQTHWSGWGFGTVVDGAGNELILLASPSFKFNKSVASVQLARHPILLNRWIVEFEGSKGRRPNIDTSNAILAKANELVAQGFEVVK
ncbi:MAG: hypothetical protein C4557_06220 [Anaerolineaceae bacterium]|jgi:hypothetical protein|nr:MAG: hypothetical protein C4557_06220 [Anaerolineaceae bacterium]